MTGKSCLISIIECFATLLVTKMQTRIKIKLNNKKEDAGDSNLSMQKSGNLPLTDACK